MTDGDDLLHQAAETGSPRGADDVLDGARAAARRHRTRQRAAVIVGGIAVVLALGVAVLGGGGSSPDEVVTDVTTARSTTTRSSPRSGDPSTTTRPSTTSRAPATTRPRTTRTTRPKRPRTTRPPRTTPPDRPTRTTRPPTATTTPPQTPGGGTAPRGGGSTATTTRPRTGPTAGPGTIVSGGAPATSSSPSTPTSTAAPKQPFVLADLHTLLEDTAAGDFGGGWNQGNGVRIGVVGTGGPTRPAVARYLDDHQAPPSLVFTTVANTYATLVATRDRIRGDDAELAAQGIQVQDVAVDEPANRVAVTVIDPTADQRAWLAARYGSGRIAVRAA